MNSDFKDLLKIFNELEIKYLIVGGYAVMKYSEPRYTKDLDIWIESSNENSKKVFSALQKFGAPLKGLTHDDFKGEGFYQMGLPPVRIDILISFSGVDFKEAWKNKTVSKLADIEINIISKNDLITNKKIAGRPQDLLDIENILRKKEL